VKQILVLGAGLVAGPLVRYLLAQEGVQVTVADQVASKAQALVAGEQNGTALSLDVSDEARVEALIASHDLSVSLLPYAFHPVIARLCVAHGKPMVTASYVKNEMRALDDSARKAGVIVLNEVGVDPGLDHMSAMRVIDRIRDAGGHLVSFSSYCGGLPAPDANDNPLGYKFSWSPRGVILAGKNPARYLEDGEIIEIPGEKLFAYHWPVEIEGLGALEGYPNRDCLPYIETYGIQGVESMFRGTLRYPGWSATMKRIAELGLLDETRRSDLAGLTYAGFLRTLVDNTEEPGSLEEDVADALGIDPDARIISNLKWLGLFEEGPLPERVKSPLDVLAARMLERMQYAPGERDLLVMQHEFLAQYPDRRERTTSTLIDYGIPNGDTSMSRTVGLPAAIATMLVLRGEIDLAGVQIPVRRELYEPILSELEGLGIAFHEKTEVIDP
jgi:saccharopine dehydrogenase-like NADP-dependent oxidoreductase